MKKLHDVYVTVRLHVVVGGLEAVPDFSEQLEHALTTYDDGRRLYSTELIQDGIGRLVVNAIHRSVTDALHTVHGNEMVPSGTGSSTSRVTLEADRKCADLSVGTNYEPAVVSVTVDSSEPGAL